MAIYEWKNIITSLILTKNPSAYLHFVYILGKTKLIFEVQSVKTGLVTIQSSEQLTTLM